MPSPSDIRLVVADMDGTLLDESGEVPSGFWPVLDRLHDLGVVFAPASGRQLATLRRQFAAHRVDTYIAENGAMVVHDGVPVGVDTLEPDVVAGLIGTVRGLTAAGRDVAAVVCGRERAWIERDDERFRPEADRYYASLGVTDDLMTTTDDVLKVAIYDFDDAETGTAPAFDRFRATHQVVTSGRHWVDVMNSHVNKGAALTLLQERLGIGADQTVAFGDYLNDLEMLDAATWSYAMANAHPLVLERARSQAPTNAEHGVVRVVADLVDRRY